MSKLLKRLALLLAFGGGPLLIAIAEAFARAPTVW
jgi:hypothetical protein